MLAGGVDIGDDDDVGVVEAFAEFGEQAGEPRIAMRLHDGDDLALVALGLLPGLERRGDLDRMMAIIVDDGDAAHLAGAGEAALDALELAHRRAQDVIGEAELVPDRDGG